MWLFPCLGSAPRGAASPPVDSGIAALSSLLSQSKTSGRGLDGGSGSASGDAYRGVPTLATAGMSCTIYRLCRNSCQAVTVIHILGIQLTWDMLNRNRNCELAVRAPQSVKPVVTRSTLLFGLLSKCPANCCSNANLYLQRALSRSR